MLGTVGKFLGKEAHFGNSNLILKHPKENVPFLTQLTFLGLSYTPRSLSLSVTHFLALDFSLRFKDILAMEFSQ